ncbi:MAG: hypothetical protein HY962_14205 [Ignavibacteriae bacterium]|nr:hypothetical protein [Ignavibacteriota bacterium]
MAENTSSTAASSADANQLDRTRSAASSSVSRHPLNPNAAFVRLALRHGLISLHAAKDWAYSVIDAEERPSIDIIDAATCRSKYDFDAHISRLTTASDFVIAGQWLLTMMRDELKSLQDDLPRVADAAYRLAVDTEQAPDIQSALDQIVDGCWLARNAGYGTLDACRHELDTVLASLDTPPQALRDIVDRET